MPTNLKLNNKFGRMKLLELLPRLAKQINVILTLPCCKTQQKGEEPF